jgi:hypothetical protein
MGSGYDRYLWLNNRRYEVVADGLEKPEARRTAERWIAHGFLARIRVYRPQPAGERRYIVYVARPRGMAHSHPMAIPAAA